jgi:hypothetical protein
MTIHQFFKSAIGIALLLATASPALAARGFPERHRRQRYRKGLGEECPRGDPVGSGCPVRDRRALLL